MGGLGEMKAKETSFLTLDIFFYNFIEKSQQISKKKVENLQDMLSP